jgi:hypothetical protein
MISLTYRGIVSYQSSKKLERYMIQQTFGVKLEASLHDEEKNYYLKI